ncbi:hypothetical protein D9M71_764130 [compost metagenome]
MHAVDLLHGGSHTLLERQQCFTDRCLTDVTNDASGDFLIGLIAPGGLQIDFAEAILVQQQANLSQVFTCQVFRPVDHYAQCSRLVDLVVDKVVEAFQIVLRLGMLAITLFTHLQYIVMRGDHWIVG